MLRHRNTSDEFYGLMRNRSLPICVSHLSGASS